MIQTYEASWSTKPCEVRLQHTCGVLVILHAVVILKEDASTAVLIMGLYLTIRMPSQQHRRWYYDGVQRGSDVDKKMTVVLRELES